LQCGFPQEDRDHILRCPENNDWRRLFLQSLRKRCSRLLTEPALQDVLIDGLETWLRADAIDLDQHPSRLHELIMEQNFIGWRQLFNGRLSTKWALVQDDYLKRIGKHAKHDNGRTWTVNVTDIIWKEWCSLWKQHNKHVHGHDSATREAANRRQAEAELRAIYELKPMYLPVDQDYLSSDVEEHLRRSTNSIRNWLQSFRPLHKHSFKEAKRRAISGMTSIAHYFGSNRDPPAG